MFFDKSDVYYYSEQPECPAVVLVQSTYSDIPTLTAPLEVA